MSRDDRRSGWFYVVVLGVFLWIALWLVLPGIEPGTGDPSPEGIDLRSEFAWVTVLVLPTAVYCDVRHVGVRGEWEPNTAFWVIGSLVWFLNVPVGVAYLLRRRRAGWPARPTRPSDLLPERPSVESRWWYVIGLQPVYTLVYVASVHGNLMGNAGWFLGGALAVVSLIGAGTFHLLYPLALYLDASAIVAADVGWDPHPIVFAGLGFVLPSLGYASDPVGVDLFAVGMVLASIVSAVYLVGRRRHVVTSGTPSDGDRSGIRQ